MATEPGPRPTGFVRDRSDGCILTVRVVPRSRQTGLAAAGDGSILVRVAAPPHEGSANAAVVDLLASILDVPRRAVTVLRGGRQRNKLIRIDGVGATVVASRIEVELQNVGARRGR